jgi:tetratricopeptide (TPR) repeat protein
MLGCASREKLLKESAQHYEYGLVCLERGDLSDAYEEFEKAKQMAPDNDRAYFGLGLTFYFQEKFQQSFKAYKKAIEINPHKPEYYNNMAAVLGKLGNWKDVIQYCQAALDNPSYTTPEFAYYNMGCAYINLNEPEKATAFLQKAKQKNPSYINIHLQLGKALFMLGNFHDALSSLKEAKHLEAEDPFEDFFLQAEIEYYLGQSYLGLGDISAAGSAFKTVIEKAPGSQLAKDSAKYLNNMTFSTKKN